MAHFPTNTMIRGAEATDTIPSARRVRDVDKRIAYVDPDSAPFIQVISRANKKVAVNSKFEWIEKELHSRWDQINNGAGYTAGATAVVVDNPKYFSVGDVAEVTRTGEKVRVTAITDGTSTLTVSRGVGATAAAAIVDNDDLLIVGNAYAEGATSGTPKSHVESYPYNLTQIVRTPFSTTGTEENSENYTGPDRPRLRAEKAIEHKMALEYLALFGERNSDTSTAGSEIRYTGGLLYYLTTWTKDFAGIMTEAEVEDACEDVFSHTGGANTRLALCAPKVISVWDQLAMGRLQLVPSDRTFGITVKQFVTGHGTLNIVKDLLLEDGPSGTANGYGGYMLLLDPTKVKYRFLRNRNTKLRMDIQANDADSWKDEYLTEVGFQVQNPSLHLVGYGITG